jgi:hypothetical protein
MGKPTPAMGAGGKRKSASEMALSAALTSPPAEQPSSRDSYRTDPGGPRGMCVCVLCVHRMQFIESPHNVTIGNDSSESARLKMESGTFVMANGNSSAGTNSLADLQQRTASR